MTQYIYIIGYKNVSVQLNRLKRMKYAIQNKNYDIRFYI